MKPQRLFVASCLSIGTAAMVFAIRGDVAGPMSAAFHITNEQMGLVFSPAFFAFTGMRTRIDLVNGVEAWLICGLIIVLATLGKFGGSFAAARLTGMSWRDSAALGALMNTRGLMELIVLNVGLDLKVISPELFSMMVIMALVTTVATSPIVRALIPAPPIAMGGLSDPSPPPPRDPAGA